MVPDFVHASLNNFIHVGEGICTPASPCMVSTIMHATVESISWSEETSLNFINATSGRSGRKGALRSVFDETDKAPVVFPWYPPVQARILLLPVMRLASLSAPSTASDPELTKYTAFNVSGSMDVKRSAALTVDL